ncbi:hypothetical protein EDB84DRAFT_1523107, partial [Lactarius hengduanensis]
MWRRVPTPKVVLLHVSQQLSGVLQLLQTYTLSFLKTRGVVVSLNKGRTCSTVSDLNYVSCVRTSVDLIDGFEETP